jgi:hypothetical protein
MGTVLLCGVSLVIFLVVIAVLLPKADPSISGHGETGGLYAAVGSIVVGIVFVVGLIAYLFR